MASSSSMGSRLKGHNHKQDHSPAVASSGGHVDEKSYPDSFMPSQIIMEWVVERPSPLGVHQTINRIGRMIGIAVIITS